MWDLLLIFLKKCFGFVGLVQYASTLYFIDFCFLLSIFLEFNLVLLSQLHEIENELCDFHTFFFLREAFGALLQLRPKFGFVAFSPLFTSRWFPISTVLSSLIYGFLQIV